MANPDAVMRAAQKPPMGGMPPGMPPEMPPKPADPGAPPMPPPGAGPAPEGGQGMDGMVENLKGVGEFLQAQGPGAQEAMGHFQALLQAMAKMGGEGAPEGAPAPGSAPMPLAKNGDGPGRVHESKVPGVQVL
jgi:hypothetical protein